MTKSKHDMHLYLRLLRYVTPYWRMFVLAIIGLVCLAATEPALAALIKPLLDGAFIENDPDACFGFPYYWLGYLWFVVLLRM